MAVVVQKFGGATVESTTKIAKVASRILEQRKKGDSLIVVVSAMGRTTDSLLELAQELSDEPPLREMDALLNTGEMISMSLLSIALNSKNCPAIGLCGHQAGIVTDRFFSNASIAEINTKRIREALSKDQVVIVAGFQGQTEDGELTTLGRGGSDTTALALAASLQADRCEILKDVPAIFSADPRVLPDAHPIQELNYDQLLEMTYWGAKVLQYRSVEIAKHFQVPLYVGPAHSQDLGTFIQEKKMIEDSEILALNSHETVLQIATPQKSLNGALKWLRQDLDARKIPFPQLLHSELINGTVQLFITGPNEVMKSILGTSEQRKREPYIRELSSVTATCRGSTRPETMEKVIDSLETKGVKIRNLLVSAMSVTVFVEKALRISAIHLLHKLVQTA
ncbi:MAG: aspartate kinase [Bdellovibrionaceae bacterium]|nr:aspartate kinase [Pseudobdellovibrionaceae bacterium]